ncbi:riboflavin biosynthesis protein RibF [Mycoplasmoides pirum]|uniref:riboflavin biosynthesis protein RibF n=1 Tax=Mycoplasmoides pirum TaxID=2122 RepID=UPI00055BC87F|nr:riboflavin biosynthesis protein RibF [Mycoplasmoides pirum]
MAKDLILGFFDGLHHGHKLLFEKSKDFLFDVLTFKNIPSKKNNFLYSEQERFNQLKKMKTNKIYLLDLNFQNMSALEFCNNFLLKKFSEYRIIVGSDYLFGRDKQNVEFLQKNFKNVLIVNRSNISTTLIKKLIKNNNFFEANKLLLEPYYRVGKVIKGKQIATSLGFPTANIECDKNLIELNEGSYIVQCVVDNLTYQGVGFVGNSKSFKESKKYIEVNIFNFNKNIYDNEIKIIFYKFIRPNEFFSNIIDLKQAIELDINTAKNYFN